MDLPNEFYEITIAVILISVVMTVVSYLTKHSRNFRCSRNRRARKQF